MQSIYTAIDKYNSIVNRIDTATDKVKGTVFNSSEQLKELLSLLKSLLNEPLVEYEEFSDLVWPEFCLEVGKSKKTLCKDTVSTSANKSYYNVHDHCVNSFYIEDNELELNGPFEDQEGDVMKHSKNSIPIYVTLGAANAKKLYYTITTKHKITVQSILDLLITNVNISIIRIVKHK